MKGENALNLIDQLLKGSLVYIATFIPLVVYTIKLTIDNWGITDLEKIILSNFKKFQIGITKYIFIGISFVVLMYIVIIVSDIHTEINDRVIWGILAVCFVFFIAGMFLFNVIVKFINNLLSFQYDYFIVNEANEPVFRIIKLSSNKSLLVESKGIEEFIQVENNIRYKKVRNPNEKLSKIYNSDKINIFFIISGIVWICLLISVFFTKSWLQFCLYLLFILIMLIFLIVLSNFIDNKRYNKGNYDNNQ